MLVLTLCLVPPSHGTVEACAKPPQEFVRRDARKRNLTLNRIVDVPNICSEHKDERSEHLENSGNDPNVCLASLSFSSPTPSGFVATVRVFGPVGGKRVDCGLRRSSATVPFAHYSRSRTFCHAAQGFSLSGRRCSADHLSAAVEITTLRTSSL